MAVGAPELEHRRKTECARPSHIAYKRACKECNGKETPAFEHVVEVRPFTQQRRAGDQQRNDEKPEAGPFRLSLVRRIHDARPRCANPRSRSAIKSSGSSSPMCKRMS